MSSSFLSVNSNTASSIIFIGSMDTSGTKAEIFIRIIIPIRLNPSLTSNMKIAVMSVQAQKADLVFWWTLRRQSLWAYLSPLWWLPVSASELMWDWMQQPPGDLNKWGGKAVILGACSALRHICLIKVSFLDLAQRLNTKMHSEYSLWWAMTLQG